MVLLFLLMRRRPPRTTRTDTLLPYTTLFRSSLSKQRANFDGGFGALYGVDRPTVPAYEVIDLRAGLDFGRYSVELFAKNLGNSHGITDVATGGGLPVAPGGAITAGIIRPRTIGITLGAGF